MCVWVRPGPHIHKECGPRFPLLLHTPCTMNCLSVSAGKGVFSVCPVRRPVRTLEWVLLKDRNLALKPGQGPEINSRACLWVCPRSRQLVQCWLNNHWLKFVIMTRHTLQIRPYLPWIILFLFEWWHKYNQHFEALPRQHVTLSPVNGGINCLRKSVL